MTESQRSFAARIVRRKKLFLGLSFAGLAGAATVIVYALIRRSYNPAFESAPRLVIAVFILLNSRQNLRQYRIAAIFEDTGIGSAGPDERPASPGRQAVETPESRANSFDPKL